ncbi:transcriptional regulator [Glutamicibacter uratoxydans]|uniref:Transcriptional regulator n=1 Tax=Glutamicibacter uratoxydans TaxID=43667 RepID=A0A4Y4DML6_GLUUR|nr:transcriptional regulator [Glutamicibacter uratoxydans]
MRRSRLLADSEFKPESLRVTERIRDEIIDGVRAPGSRLVERELAEELGVSRLPIRDALHILANEGLITPRPRTWAVVREFSASDIADLQEVREAMEVMTFKLAAQRHTRNGLDELRAVLETEIEASKKQDYVTARRAGAKFHELVVGLAGNELLIELQAGLSSRMRWLLSQHDDLEIMAEEHAQILEAMASRNLELVERLVLQHIATSKGSVDEKRASMQ